MNIALPLDWDMVDEPAPSEASWAALPPSEQLLLWSVRHMLVCWPTCASVRAALHGRYGENALGVEHLLRCLLHAVSVWSRRRLAVGDPTCALLLPDERALLDVMRHARSDQSTARASLVELCDEPRAAALLPLATSLAEVADLSRA